MFEQDSNRSPEEMSLDELLDSAKAALDGSAIQEDTAAPKDPFEPDLPSEYADLKTDEELSLEEEALWAEEDGKKAVPPILKVLLYVCSVLAAAVLLAVTAWECADEVLALTAEDQAVTVTVEENATINDVADMLKEQGLIGHKWMFKFYCMISNAEAKIDPGTYELNAVYDYHALVNCMIASSGNRSTVTVTIPEGYETEDIFVLLEEKGVCSVSQLEEAAANYEFSSPYLQELEYGDYRRVEGYLFPDTYEFYVGDTPENVLSKLLRNFDNKILDEFYGALDALNADLKEKMLANGFTEAEVQEKLLSFHDMIIVASLVEKETTGSSASSSIASVIYNRLCSKVYPCLNIDATIQYVLPERKETLTLADKSIVSPYNTYTNAGLPVGPISSPGINSIRAALYPAETDYYFYAKDTDGKLQFFSNYYDYEQLLRVLNGEDAVTEDETGDTTDDEQA